MLEAFQFALSAGEGALKALLRLPNGVEQEDMVARILGLVVKIGFGHLNAHQFPLGNGHLLDIIAFGGGVGLPLEFEIAGELVELGGVFSFEDDFAGAETVADGIAADSFLTLGRYRAGTF